MNPLDEKANTLSRCGSFYYRTLVDDSKADAEFVSHTHSYTRLMALGDKITTAIKGGCYYEDYYKIIKFTDSDIDWNGVKEALQHRIRGGMGAITSELEYVSSSKARELGTSAWVLLKEDVPTGLIDVASVQMQTISTAPIATPVFLQVYIIDPEGTAMRLATSTQSVTLAAGEFAEWSFAEALIGTDIYKQNSQVAFQFTTNANATWQDNDYVPAHLAVGAGSYVPAVQFYRLAAAPALPSFSRPAQLTIEDHFFMGDDKWNWLSKEGTPQPIAFPGGERDIILPETQELIWDLHIDEHIMVTSIKMDDGTMLYANQDFASQFGKLTFLKNPIALFPKMQFMAQSYTGRMPNLYNYLVRADEVYGSVGKMMNYMRGSQSIKSLYHASAQAAGLAVIEKACTVVAVSPLLEGKLYITTAGRYEANYPHTPLKPGTKLPKDYIIGGNQLYRLIGPYDPIPSNITGINLGSALPVPGLIAPNKDIVIRRAFNPYAPEYEGNPSAISAYHDYIESMTPAITTVNVEEGITNLTPYISTIPSDSSWQLLLYDKNLAAESMAYTFEFDTYTLTVGYTADLKLYVQGNRIGSAAPNVTLTPESVDLGDGGLKLDSFTTLSLNKEFEYPVWPEIASVSSQQITVTEKNNFFVESVSANNRTTGVLIKLTYDAQLKQLACQLILLRGFIEVFQIGGVDSVITAYTPRCFKGAGNVALTTYLPNWEINNIQSVYTEAASEISVSSIAGKVSDTDYPEIQYPETSEPEYIENGINHFRYTACPNRCVVACINESYMTSQMKMRLMTYLQRELPIGSVLTTANLPNIVNEFQSTIDGTEFVLEELRAGLNKLVGAGNYEVEFDTTDNKLIVHTDRLDDTQLAVVTDLIEGIVPSSTVIERYNHNIEISWRDINKYAACATVADMQAVNPDYKNDLTSDGEWIYPLPELINGSYAFARSANLICFFADLPKLTNGSGMFRNMPKMEKFKGSLKALKNGAEMFCYSYSVTIFDSTLESLNEGIYIFTGGQLDKESALNVLYSVPSYTNRTPNLMLGIHVDHKLDEEVLAAIAAAEAKGWKLGVNWNGKPTSGISTLDLEEIYAKVTESEYGDYTDENGNRCILDWGHYVTDTTGYKLFFSIYEAEQYFKLSKIEEPEQLIKELENKDLCNW